MKEIITQRQKVDRQLPGAGVGGGSYYLIAIVSVYKMKRVLEMVVMDVQYYECN